MITEAIRTSVEKSVLCWLATSSQDAHPNVSPKELFYLKDEALIIANIASPKSAKNIMINEKVCVAFVDILVQKGYQLYGDAKVIDNSQEAFAEYAQHLIEMTNGKYPFKSLFKINITSAKPIIAPSYFLFPNISEEDKIAAAKKQYDL